MFICADNYDINKGNKWENQKFHKKKNKIQRASKHYKESPLISNKKYPNKQRKHVKKCNMQRQRKQIYEQLIFDYHEYEYECEYAYEYQYEYDYYTDYHSQNIANGQLQDIAEYQSKFDGIDVDIKYYCIDDSQHSPFDRINEHKVITDWHCPRCTFIQPLHNKTCCLCLEAQPNFYKDFNLKNQKQQYRRNQRNQRIIGAVGTTVKIYKNNVNIETKQTEQLLIYFDPFYSYFNGETTFKKIEKTLTESIINKSIKMLKGSVKKGNAHILKLFTGIKTNKIVQNMQINYTYPNVNNNNQKINLKNVLYEIIPELWFMYDFLCQYIGYKCLNIFVAATATIRNLKTLRTYNIIPKHQTSNNGHGISYYEQDLSPKTIKYSDLLHHLYTKSYIRGNNCKAKQKKIRNKAKTTDSSKLCELYTELHRLRDKIYEIKRNIFQLEVYCDAEFIPNCLRKKVSFPNWCFKRNHCLYTREGCIRGRLWKANRDALGAMQGRIANKQKQLRQTKIEYKFIYNQIIEHKLRKVENNCNTQRLRLRFRITNSLENKCNIKELIKKRQLRKDQQKILLQCDKLFKKIHLEIKNSEYVNLLNEAKQNEMVLLNEENTNCKSKDESYEMDKIYLIYDDIYDNYYDENVNKLCFKLSNQWDTLAYLNSVNLDEKMRRKIVSKYGDDTDKNRLKYRNKAIKKYGNTIKQKWQKTNKNILN